MGIDERGGYRNRDAISYGDDSDFAGKYPRDDSLYRLGERERLVGRVLEIGRLPIEREVQ